MTDSRARQRETHRGKGTNFPELGTYCDGRVDGRQPPRCATRHHDCLGKRYGRIAYSPPPAAAAPPPPCVCATCTRPAVPAARWSLTACATRRRYQGVVRARAPPTGSLIVHINLTRTQNENETKRSLSCSTTYV